MTNEVIESISLKIENGGLELNYDDMQYLLCRSRAATAIMQRIALVSSSPAEHSSTCALNTVRALATDFLEQN